MSLSKKLTYKGTLRHVFYLSEVPSPPMTPCSLPPYTLYTCIQYTYSHREGGGESYPERRLLGQQFTKPVENTNMIDCTVSPVYTLLNTSIKRRHLRFGVFIVIQSMHKPLPDIRRRIFATHPRTKQTHQVVFRGRSETENKRHKNKVSMKQK